MGTDKSRRQLIKMSLAGSLVGVAPWQQLNAAQRGQNGFAVPQHVLDAMVKVFGDRAHYIMPTDRLNIQAPQLAETNLVVPVNVSGEQGLVSKLALFVEANPEPHAGSFTFHTGTDVSVQLRIRLAKTSQIYAVADTPVGLLGVSQLVKYAIGCGGA